MHKRTKGASTTEYGLLLALIAVLILLAVKSTGAEIKRVLDRVSNATSAVNDNSSPLELPEVPSDETCRTLVEEYSRQLLIYNALGKDLPIANSTGTSVTAISGDAFSQQSNAGENGTTETAALFTWDPNKAYKLEVSMSDENHATNYVSLVSFGHFRFAHLRDSQDYIGPTPTNGIARGDARDGSQIDISRAEGTLTALVTPDRGFAAWKDGSTAGCRTSIPSSRSISSPTPMALSIYTNSERVLINSVRIWEVTK